MGAVCYAPAEILTTRVLELDMKPMSGQRTGEALYTANLSTSHNASVCALCTEALVGAKAQCVVLPPLPIRRPSLKWDDNPSVETAGVFVRSKTKQVRKFCESPARTIQILKLREKPGKVFLMVVHLKCYLSTNRLKKNTQLWC